MSKKILHTFMTLAATLILTGGFSMTAYAGGGEEYEITEPTPATEPEENTDPSDPLTPEGNATLVDDIYGENKQLITVTTKSGNYFYILIDRAAEGENTVHFLNKVDEADLMALMEETETAEESREDTAIESGQQTANANENGWGDFFSTLGLSGMGDISKNLGYVLAMLPDILVGMFTGRTKSLDLGDNVLPIASIVAGIFIKNPILKMMMIGLGGANLLNKAGHEALGWERNEDIGLNTG